MLRTYFSGASDVIDSSSLSIAMAAGGSTVERIWNRSTRRANSRGSKPSITTTGAPTRRAKSTW